LSYTKFIIIIFFNIFSVIKAKEQTETSGNFTANDDFDYDSENVRI